MQKNNELLRNKINIFAFMIRVVILGGGKVANHLAKAFLQAKNKIQLVQIYARNCKQIEHLKPYTLITNSINNIQNADIYIIAVSDNAISEISRQIKTSELVVHTSGSVTLDSLKNKGNKGVFYPLQSFSTDKNVNFDEIPFCLEAETPEDLKLLNKLASFIGKKIYNITSEQRRYLHVAAVFVNNFVNHLYKIGNDICNTYDVPFEVLHPLIKETASKLESLTPNDAQTGPAVRKDNKTIKNHLDLLTEKQQNIYKLLTDSIINGEKL